MQTSTRGDGSAQMSHECRGRPLTPAELETYGLHWSQEEDEEEEQLRAQWEMLQAQQLMADASSSSATAVQVESDHMDLLLESPPSPPKPKHSQVGQKNPVGRTKARNSTKHVPSDSTVSESMRSDVRQLLSTPIQTSKQAGYPESLQVSKSCSMLPSISPNPSECSKSEMPVPYSRKSTSVSALRRKVGMVTTMSSRDRMALAF